MSDEGCGYCGVTGREMRPYGPGGQPVCSPCVRSTPEREAAAIGAFLALLDAAGSLSETGVVVIGTSAGPQPFTWEAPK